MQIDFKSLLCNFICEKPDSYIVDQILTRFPTPRDLMDASEKELESIKGVGKVGARKLVAALKYGPIISLSTEPTIKVKTPEDVYKLLKPTFLHLKKEHFVAIFLNSKNMVLGWETISIGSLNACIVHPREVFNAAIKRRSASIICAHNHPSGNPDPSNEDIEITKRLKAAGDIIGIELLDHIIIGHANYISLKERGFM
jgi:DNA repair protein RadC